MYGKVQGSPQNEHTPFYPRSPYAVAKLFAYWITINYREAYNIYAVNGILFNHESPVRGETFVTRKITRGIARILFGLQDKIYLGNLDAKRDWGHAKDYAEAMWLMLQQPVPEDYVIATGITTSVRDFVQMAFAEAGITIEFKGKGEGETAVITKVAEPAPHLEPGKVVVAIDPKYYRPTEVDYLVGDPSKAHRQLGWTPEYDLESLVREMVRADVELFRREKLLKDSGFYVNNQFE
jgi:GDPmannose 4,6-dehydratase